MNQTALLLAALVGSIAVNVQAGELYTPGQYQDAPSALTRAQVRQSVLQARKTGELNHNDVDLPDNGVMAFGNTRTQVRGDVLAARANGGLEHNDVDLPSVAKGSVLSRRQVRDDAIAARRNGSTAPSRNTVAY